MRSNQVPPAPSSLNLKTGKDLWSDIWQYSPAVKVGRDDLAVQDICETYQELRWVVAQMQKLEKASEGSSRIHSNPNGTVQHGIWYQQKRDLKKELREMMRELGMTPAAAAKLQVEDLSDTKVIEALLMDERDEVLSNAL